MAWDDNLSGAFVSRIFYCSLNYLCYENNRLLTALRYVGDRRATAPQYLIATASAQEVTQAYDVFVTTLEEL